MAMRAIGWLVLPLVTLVGCTGSDGADVELGTVDRATVTEVVEAPATVVAKASATVTAQAAGRIETLNVDEGQQVTAGDVLLTIDSPDAEEQLEQAQSAVDAAEQSGYISFPRADFARSQAATDAAAEDAFARAREVADKIPDEPTHAALLAQIDQSEAAYAAISADAQAAVRNFNAGLASIGEALNSLSAAQRAQAQAALTIAEQRIEALTVRAPINGTVVVAPSGGQQAIPDVAGLLDSLPATAGLVGEAAGGGGQDPAVPTRPTLEIGTPVSAGAPLISIVDMSVLSLAAEVDETDVLLVTPGVPAEIEVDAVPGGSYSGTVDSVDLSPTQSSRGGVSYVVRLSLGPGSMPDSSAAPTLLPGMSAVARLEVRTETDAIAVPSSAIIREGDRDTVWVVLDGRAVRRVVTLGAQGEDMVAVARGLAVGDRIVTRGADQVSEGDELP
jgi:multidrug efflux pump subunit AcrA (membrane-fusion protein)